MSASFLLKLSTISTNDPARLPLLFGQGLEQLRIDQATQRLVRQVGAQGVPVAGRSDQDVPRFGEESRVPSSAPPLDPRRPPEIERDDGEPAE